MKPHNHKNPGTLKLSFSHWVLVYSEQRFMASYMIHTKVRKRRWERQMNCDIMNMKHLKLSPK
jgi:hypothetical protein